MEPAAVQLEDSKGVVAEQSKRVVVHGAQDLTPIQAISHGPITIGGTSLCLLYYHYNSGDL
jgi:hypothetical protein